MSIQIYKIIVPVKQNDTDLKNNIAEMYDVDKNDVLTMNNKIGKGMSEKFNQALKEIDLNVDDSDRKWIIFQHDDIKVFATSKQIIDIMEKAIDKIDTKVQILAIAGRTDSAPPVNPGIWWHGMGTPEFRGSGQVEHVDPSGNYFITSYGPYPQQISAFDGCWFAIRVDALKTKRLRFDDITLKGFYHYYDADFAAIARSLNIIMATCGLHISHDSRGEGITEPEFRKAQQAFIKKWFKSQNKFSHYEELVSDVKK